MYNYINYNIFLSMPYNKCLNFLAQDPTWRKPTHIVDSMVPSKKIKTNLTKLHPQGFLMCVPINRETGAKKNG